VNRSSDLNLHVQSIDDARDPLRHFLVLDVNDNSFIADGVLARPDTFHAINGHQLRIAFLLNCTR